MDREDWNRRYAGAELLWSAAPNPLLASAARRLRPGRALDLGAGEGRNAVWLAARRWRVTAIDFSPAGLAKARRLARAHRTSVRWVLADVRCYRPRRAFYDLVLICYLQLPRQQRERVLASARAAVAPGGTLLYIGHDRSNLDRGTGGPRDPRVLCTPQEVVAALPGFEIMEARVVRRAVSADPGHGGVVAGVARDALVRARRAPLGAGRSEGARGSRGTPCIRRWGVAGTALALIRTR